MDYSGGPDRGPQGGRGRGRGRGRGGPPRERSFSPPLQRGSPVYDRYGQGGRGQPYPPRGRRDDYDYREDRGAYRGGGGDERGFDRRRPQYDRGGPGRYSAGVMDRDRDFYGGPPDDYAARGPGANAGGAGSRGRGASVGDSPEYPGGGGRRMSRGMSPEDSGAPLSKVMFIKRMIDEDLPEQEIDRRYTEYLASKFKSKNKAEFERQKNGDAFKRRFDPFMFKEEVEARAHVAQTASLTFGKDSREGKYDYTAEGKQQLLLPSEYKKAVAAKSPAPVIAWHPHVIGACWKVACRLVAKLDAEKHVSRDCMDWVDSELAAHGTPKEAPKEAAEAGEDKGADGAGSGGDAPEAEAVDGDGTTVAEADDAAGEAAEGGHEEMAADGGGGVPDASTAAAPASRDAYLLQPEDLKGDDLAARTGQLDVMLEYLWQVHGIDFYSGADGELSVEVYKSVKERLKRTSPDVEFRAMRTQKPLSGALVDERKKEQVTEEFHHIVTKPWIERLERVDADTQKALDLDRELEAAVDVATKGMLDKSKYEDRNQTSYKCAFCDKKFKGLDYLRKHIGNKHGDEFQDFKEQERLKAREDLFFKNFELHQADEDAHQAEEGAMDPGAPRMPPGGPMQGVMPPMAFPMPMQAQMMQMMMAGINPMAMGGPPMGMNPMMMEQMMMAGRGGGGGRMMGGRGGRGGRGRRGPPAYYDFDSFANQRDQLNYGDI
eukprot:jgi/Ulvmu1/9723/UM055_0062.1